MRAPVSPRFTLASLRHCERCASSAKQSRATRAHLTGIASAGTQVEPARLAHKYLPTSGKPEIGARLAMTKL
jgi:hypothetical protein